LEGVGERDLLAADGAGRLLEGDDQVRQVVAPVGERGDEARAVGDEVLEGRGVAIELVEEAARGGQRRVQVLEADVLHRGLALDELVGVQERRLDRVAPAAPEDEHADEQHRCNHCANSRNTPYAAYRPHPGLDTPPREPGVLAKRASYTPRRPGNIPP